MGIATPGPTKQRTTQELEPFWARAKSELTEARSVVFVGYRFPPSDAQARAEVLGALQASSARKLDLSIVLGVEGNADVHRLKALLEATMRTAQRTLSPSPNRSYRIHQYPLYSQDFLGLYDSVLSLRPH